MVRVQDRSKALSTHPPAKRKMCKRGRGGGKVNEVNRTHMIKENRVPRNFPTYHLSQTCYSVSGEIRRFTIRGKEETNA